MTDDEARQLADELEGWFTTEDGKKYRGRLLEAFRVLREQADEIDWLRAQRQAVLGDASTPPPDLSDNWHAEQGWQAAMEHVLKLLGVEIISLDGEQGEHPSHPR